MPPRKKPDLRRSYEKKEVVKAPATQTAELLLDPKAQAIMKKTREHHDARASGIKASSSMTLRGKTGSNELMELGRGNSEHMQAEETVSIETLLKRYLVRSMREIPFSPVTELIRNIVNETSFKQGEYGVDSPITIQGNIFGVTLGEGAEPLLSENYHKIFNASMGEDDDQIQRGLEYKKTWLDEPSSVTNACASAHATPVRTESAGSTSTQFNAVNKLTGPISPPYEPTNLIPVVESIDNKHNKKYINRSNDQINRCCICGLGDPPKLTDMEHVVSSQLLIWLGINPGLLSARVDEFIEATSYTDDDDGDISVVADNLPGNSKKEKMSAWIQRIATETEGTDAIRSMFLPAHAHCNRNIKSEHNPFMVIDDGTIYANLQKVQKNSQTYQQIIQKAIVDTAGEQTLSGVQLETHKTTWIGIQQREFDKIAGFLNTVDNMTKTASLQIIQNMWNSISSNSDDREISAFRDFITNLLPPMMTTPGDNVAFINDILTNYENTISENLSLIHKKILASFTFCIHKPQIAESPQRIGTTGVNPDNTGDTQTSHSIFSPGGTEVTEGDDSQSLVGESPPNSKRQLQGRPLTGAEITAASAASAADIAAEAPNNEERNNDTQISDLTASQNQNRGGKRTKRRRGRGKSKKKVTRKKRVKRRKTVKKIKRKRRTTRKR